MSEFEVRPLHPVFAAELIGADLTQPPTPELVTTVNDAMDRHAVLVVRNDAITDEQQIRFSRAFGPLEIPSRPKSMASKRMAPELFAAGNLDPDGNIMPYANTAQHLMRGAERFHTDSSFHTMPTKWSLLLGVETPPPEAGGHTLFADMRAAYDDLPDATKTKIENLVGLHDFWKGRRLAGLTREITEHDKKIIPFPTVEHKVVRTMPYGRKAIYVGGHCFGIVGMPEEEGLALVQELYAHATQDKYIYTHHWRHWDLTIWDNRCTMHAATPLFSDAYRRDMRRTTTNEYGPEGTAAEAMGIAV